MKIENIAEDYVSNYKTGCEISNDGFLSVIKQLHAFHMDQCSLFSKVLKSTHAGDKNDDEIVTLEDIPYIHANAFKKMELVSVSKDRIYLTLRSSGTTGNPSLIGLSRQGARLQRLGLSKIFNEFIDIKRPIMLVIDERSTISKNTTFTARKAGIIGFGQLCRKQIFLLDDGGRVDHRVLEESLVDETLDSKILVYGFTHIIWDKLKDFKIGKNLKDLLGEKGIMLHGGGWKKMEKDKIGKEEFKELIKEKLGIRDVRNYYGMVEQTGSIFIECEHGLMHENHITRILSRSQEDLSISKKGATGVAQVMSALPVSYPGHSILTDDLIEIVGSGKCRCGRRGQAFKVLGRMKKLEPRGCSDAYV